MSDLIPVEIPPGVVATPTESGNSSNWREVNMFRWDGDVMEPIGGWEQFNFTPPESKVRRVHSWRDNTNRLWTAFLCEGHIYVEYDGDLFDISPTPALEAPPADYSAGGYGDDVFGGDDYGDARANAPQRKDIGPSFKLDNWGENLLIMTSSDGRLLEWVPNDPPAAAEVVANAPSGRTFVVTPERHVIVFDYDGIAGGFAWCDQEDNTDWNYADVTSKAGNHKVEPAAPIVAAEHVGEAGTLFFTTKKPYVTQYIGLPYIYTNGVEQSAGGIPISPQSLVRIDDGAIWPSEGGFWRFNGVSIEPVHCAIWAWIVENVDWNIARRTAVGVDMKDHSEMWWFFPTVGSEKNTRLAIYNYRDRWWSQGVLSRSAAYTSDFIGYPIMADDLVLYKHGSGNHYPGADKPWAETFDVSIRGGAQFNTVRRIKPEIEGAYENIRYSLAYYTKRTPRNEQYSDQRQLQQETGEVWFDQFCMGFRLRLDYVGVSVEDVTIGPILFDVAPRGNRT